MFSPETNDLMRKAERVLLASSRTAVHVPAVAAQSPREHHGHYAESPRSPRGHHTQSPRSPRSMGTSREYNTPPDGRSPLPPRGSDGWEPSRDAPSSTQRWMSPETMHLMQRAERVLATSTTHRRQLNTGYASARPVAPTPVAYNDPGRVINVEAASPRSARADREPLKKEMLTGPSDVTHLQAQLNAAMERLRNLESAAVSPGGSAAPAGLGYTDERVVMIEHTLSGMRAEQVALREAHEHALGRIAEQADTIGRLSREVVELRVALARQGKQSARIPSIVEPEEDHEPSLPAPSRVAPRDDGAAPRDDGGIVGESAADAVLHRGYVRKRRPGVSAEAGGSLAEERKYEPVYHHKSGETRLKIAEAVKSIFLFRELDEEQQQLVYDAMFEVEVEEGESVIKQGSDGDYFYVVCEGEFDIFVQKGGDPPVKVVTIGENGSFGELALMYNAKRAATVVASTPGLLYALDRQTFRWVLRDTASRKRAIYKDFLREVPILSDLNTDEINRIADVLKSVTYRAGETVILQGDAGEAFFILEQGEAKVVQTKGPKDKGIELGRLKRSSYFGELALLTAQPRVASVIAVTDLKCLCLDRPSFTRLLGPIEDILHRNTEHYKTYDLIVAEQQAEAEGPSRSPRMTRIRWIDFCLHDEGSTPDHDEIEAGFARIIASYGSEDVGEDDIITREHLRAFCDRELEGAYISDGQIEELMNIADCTGTGTISFFEFAAAVKT